MITLTYIVSGVYLVMILMTILGADDMLELEYEDSVPIFGLRNILAFLVAYLWMYPVVGHLFGILIGVVFAGIHFGLTFMFSKMSTKSMHQIEDNYSDDAVVYSTVGKTVGFIRVQLNGKYEVVKAITHQEDEIPTGATVRVESKLGDIFVVSLVN